MMAATTARMHLQDASPGRGDEVPDPVRMEELLDGADERLVCAVCEQPITRAAWAVERAGRHRHTCVNPAGLVYRIALYAQAPGCREQGAWSSEYSWFVGCLWQIVSCGRCGTHLGWRFRGEGRFHGLIRERLVQRAH